MPKTILLVFYDLGLGGVQTKIVDIINYIHKHYPDTKVHLLLRTRSKFDKSDKIVNPNLTIHIYRKKSARSGGPFFFTAYVIYKCLTLNPDSVLCFLSPFSLPVLLAKIILFWRKTAVVVNEDNYTSGVINTYKYVLLNKTGIRLLYPLADKIIVPTKAVRNDLINTFGVPEKKIAIVPNWTAIQHGTTNNKLTDMIYAGRLDKTKRVLSLIKYIKELKKDFREISLKIFGDGTEKKLLQKYIDNNGLKSNISVNHPVNNIIPHIKKAKIFVFITQKRGEGFPFAVLEAMANGTPVISYNFAGINETLIDGINGFTYNNQKEFITKCKKLLKDPELGEAIAANALITIKKKHVINNIQQYLYYMGLKK